MINKSLLPLTVILLSYTSRSLTAPASSSDPAIPTLFEPPLPQSGPYPSNDLATSTNTVSEAAIPEILALAPRTSATSLPLASLSMYSATLDSINAFSTTVPASPTVMAVNFVADSATATAIPEILALAQHTSTTSLSLSSLSISTTALQRGSLRDHATWSTLYSVAIHSSSYAQPTTLDAHWAYTLVSSTSTVVPISSSALVVIKDPVASSPTTTASTSDTTTGTSTYSSSTTAFIEPPYTHSFSHVVPIPSPTEITDPDPDVAEQGDSDTTERARKTAILAALLTVGTLGAFAVSLLCIRCNLLPCCGHNSKRRRARACDPESVTDENLQKRPLRSEKHVTFQEPKAPDLVTLPVLSRESHTPSCSTCPDDVPLHSGAGWDAPIDWRIYATNGEDEFEDVTDILAMPVSESESGSERDQQSSRASGGAASLTADSYTTCESRYSSPSIEEGASAPSASIASELHSPSPPPSELIRTPAQPEYIPETGVVALNRNSTGSADMEIDSEWDVAHTYDPSSRTKTSDPVLDKVTGTIAVGGRTCVLIHG